MKYRDSGIFQFESRAHCRIWGKNKTVTKPFGYAFAMSYYLKGERASKVFSVEKHKYFQKHHIFTVLKECNLNSTTELCICQNNYMKQTVLFAPELIGFIYLYIQNQDDE